MRTAWFTSVESRRSNPVTRQLEPQPLTASIDVAASPSAVWRVVSDVRRTGEWSPECSRVLPWGGSGSVRYSSG
ncbi:SRPBCC family protein [Jatrophihabitans lederbergiae]|uniref:SRPBCC family protein n=1 Tax=Jatrophihabitans lederbergiae TaxID=3075547 RepID=UPI0037C0D4BC